MSALGLAEAVAGGLLLFFLPGYAWCRALFPEWRIAGPTAAIRAVETVTLSFVFSLSATILIGFSLTFAPTAPFPAGWSDPVLESALAIVALLGLAVAIPRGAFSRTPPAAPVLEPTPGADSPEPILEELSRLNRDQRRIEHRLRRKDLPGVERARLEEEREELRARLGELKRRREGDYAA